MPIIVLIIWLGLIGLITWAVITYIPMPPAIKTLIIAVVVIAVVLWILQMVGVGLGGPALPRLR